jgi:5-(carboxyamino)imidazole ribonucleotide synthase
LVLKGFSGDVENIEKIKAGTGLHRIFTVKTRFEKMGHVTIVNKDINEARRIEDVKKHDKSINQSIKLVD